jgi:NCAIR mutase (PurE)-related protein
LDFERETRIGLSEAVLCARKTPAQIGHILALFQARGRPCLLTRLDPDKHRALPGEPLLDYCPLSQTAFAPGPLPRRDGRGVAIVSGGSSDAPAALEAARTLEFHGTTATLFQDLGVTGLWRLLERIEEIRAYPVVIAVAGMEGALFSALGGLVAAPVIALPTSVGYGVAKGGRLSLHAALGSCAPGVLVVNIDNGYGAACAALRMLGMGQAHG